MELFFSTNFKKKYKKLDKKSQQQVKDRLDIFKENPSNSLLRKHQLKGILKNHFSINITGDNRAIYYELNSNSTMFTDIGTHHELYGK